jgi:isocitrate dehydrogenase (NAD+)
MAHVVTLIPGDGVGPEVARATQRLIRAAGVAIDWEEVPAGEKGLELHGDPLPPVAIESIRRTRVGLKGRISTPVGKGYESPNVRLRKALDLFAAVRPIRTLRGLPTRYDPIDVVVIRECTEDVYAGIEHEIIPGVVQSLKVTTRRACERIIRYAFGYATRHQRKLVTVVHKANIMKRSDGLFIRTAEEVAREFPAIALKTIIADNACMQLVKWPQQFDVMVAQNLFGDLLSDLGAGLVGGISAVWGVLRDETDLHVYEAIHGVAEPLAGTGRANPLPFVLPAAGMLRHLGEDRAARAIHSAIEKTLQDGVKTRDLGGDATTESFVDALIARLE